MKTLILYASKYGAVKEIAKRIADKLGNAVLHDLKQKNVPQLSDFDLIIIGSSVYAGQIRKEAKAFAAKNAEELSKKPLGIFLSCFTDDSSYFTKNFPPQIIESAKSKAMPGGIFDPTKAGGFERFMVKLAMKETAYVNKIDDNKIAQFAESLKNE